MSCSRISHILSLSCLLVGLFVVPSFEAQATDIPMLPPTGCPSSGVLGVVGWINDNSSPLGCITGFSADNSGNLTLSGQLSGNSILATSNATVGGSAFVGGNVGVGTMNPGAELQVSGAINKPMALFTGKDLRTPAFDAANPDPSNYVFLNNENSTQTWGLRVGPSGDFAIHQANIGDRVTVSSNGNVGIGTIILVITFALN